MTIEWILEQHRFLRYSQARQLAVTAVGAVGIGLAASVHLRTPFALEATLPMVTHVALCCIATLTAHRRLSTSPELGGDSAIASERELVDDGENDWEADFERNEAERLEHLQRIISAQDAL